MTVVERLNALKDTSYAAFQRKLIPTVDEKKVIGVRVPLARKLAKELMKEGGYENFLLSLPHDFYDEDMLHGLLISEQKDYELCIRQLEQFLPYVDNWAVCDIMSPKVFKKHKEELLERVFVWISSDEVYTCRFGIKMLMTYFLDEDFKVEYLDAVVAIRSGEYYVNMMIAWYFATALAKQWEATLPYLTGKRLDVWTHNKTIQKAIESDRITEEEKKILKPLKRS
ncbi:3-methyladenine DNA glycosylase AlkD [Lachnospiraceae bacterium KHCPX20]|nr:3-methyladenine DNA glycosylase AlkD [Lachnospiraceae bacterium KHCPX20]